MTRLETSTRRLLLTLFAIAIAIESVGHAIEGGRNANPGEFPFVYGLSLAGTGETEGVATGFAVHPRLILTAAHCFEQDSRLVGITNANDSAGGNALKVEAYEAHPDYRTVPGQTAEDREAHLRKYAPVDIAWIRLANDAPGPFPKIRILRSAEDKAAVSAGDVTMVGFGSDRFNPGDLRSMSGVGVKRTAQQRISVIDDGFMRIRDGAKLLVGDSGGPLLQQNGSILEVLGIAHAFTPALREVPVLDRHGAPKRKRNGEIRSRTEIFYQESDWLAFTEENLCWVQASSGIDLGLDLACPTTTEPANRP